MPFKPYGQEEWLDTSDEEDFDEDLEDTNDDDSDDMEEDADCVPTSTKSSDHMQKESTSTGTWSHHGAASHQDGQSYTSRRWLKGQPPISSSGTNAESKLSTSTVTFPSEQTTPLVTTQRTSSELWSPVGTKARRQRHYKLLERPLTRRSTSSSTHTESSGSTTTEHSTLKPETTTTTELATSLTGLKLNGAKSSKDLASESDCKTTGKSKNV